MDKQNSVELEVGKRIRINNSIGFKYSTRRNVHKIYLQHYTNNILKGERRMKRKVMAVFFASSLFFSVVFGIFFVTLVRANVDDTKNQDQYSLIDVYSTQNDMAGIYFDRAIYYPDVRVFWEPNLSVPIKIRVVDRDLNDNYVKVNVSSSIDSKEVTLTKDILGIFSGTVFAVSIRLMDEPVLNTSSLNVRYGDEIVAEYFDMRSGNSFTASAFFIFPHYVMEKTRMEAFENGKGLESEGNIVMDSNGIPMVNYGSTIGIQYNPVTVSAHAVANYHTYMIGENTTRRERHLAQANWLVENAKQKGNYSVWEYNFDWSSYGCTKPWVSAMAQGLGLSALMRAYVLTGNISYIDVAEEITLSFQVEMSAGGVRYTDSDGVWFEECADVGAPSSKVLNGFLFALLGLYEYSFETNSSKGWTFFWEGAETLSNNIYRYDSGSWSYYDMLHHSSATSAYHETHIEQLRTLYELTGDEIFLYYSDKFRSYISLPPPPPPPPTPKNTLTVYTLPSGVTFTVDGVSHMSPWSEAYENGTLVSLVMPETHTIGDSNYYWDQWSDGNTGRSRTFTMDTNITLAAYFTLPHDVAVISVTASPTMAPGGQPISISVTVQNQGTYTESFNVTAYYNSNIIEKQPLSLDRGASAALTFTWNTTEADKGDCAISAEASVVPGETDMRDNVKATNSMVTILSPGHDVAIKSVTPCKTVVGQGYSLFIYIIPKNYGSFTETFNITVYYNETNLIATQNFITLTSGNSTTITFPWNTTGLPYGNYTIRAVADAVPGETETADNTSTYDKVLVTLVGDANGDCWVDWKDLLLMLVPAYGTTLGDPTWNPNCDFNGDNCVDWKDLLLELTPNYNQHWP